MSNFLMVAAVYSLSSIQSFESVLALCVLQGWFV